jgi:riboflavin synthase
MKTCYNTTTQGGYVFTGIIEESGVIRSLRAAPVGANLDIDAGRIAPELRIGDSVAVNGVCLTVVGVAGRNVTFDLSAETLRRSSFAHAGEGRSVNLERAMAIGDRLGGHLVQGHVDGIGRLLSSVPKGDGYEMEFSVPVELERYLVAKGSVAIDGISLTVALLKPQAFTVAVIPHTYRMTNLRQLKSGDVVNLEGDILGKYIERFLQLGVASKERSASGLSVESLREQGF